MSNEKRIPLHDTRFFSFISGLWKGKRPPYQSVAVLRSTNFRGDGLFSYDDIALLDVEERQFESRELRRGDIVIERSGGGPKQPVGRVAYFDPPDELRYATSNFTTVLRVVDQDVFDPEYVCLILHSLYLSGATETLQRATTGIRNLDWKEYQSFEIPQLAIEDQKTVAAFIKRAQEGITAEDVQISTLAELKRAAMHELFTRGLRGEMRKETEIGFIPASWDVVSCESLAEATTVGVVVRPASYYTAFGVPAFRSLNIKEDRIEPSPLVFFSPEDNEGVLSKSRLRTDDVLVVRTGYPGTSCVVPPKYDGANCIDLVVIRPKHDTIVSGFLSRFLNSDFGKSQALSNSYGLAQQHLNVGAVKRLQVPLPKTLDEQREIVEVLNAVDQKIDLHQRKRAVLGELFIVLLRKLMSGELSVADLDISMLGKAASEEIAA